MDLSSVPEPAIRAIWPEAEAPEPPYQGPCPNCAATGPKPHLLDVAWTAPKLQGGDRKPVYACPTCEARFYPPLDVPNYHDPDVMDWGWHQFHIQQGAGLVPITETIGRIARPPGTRFLEIGCGYGFGLDFAIRSLGWQGIGIDPSPMARLGAADLGITINDGYFPQADPEAALWDVIAATEVIEHVETPSDLLAAIRTRLAPGGILLLTTPDGAAINRTTPEAALVQLLAPGIHMVFQTEASLRHLLDRGGFTSAGIGRDGLTLVVYAASVKAGPIEAALTDDDAAQRQRFRAYLTDRAKTTPLTSDLGLGFAGRALFEATINLDWHTAQIIRDDLWPAIKARFELDLDQIPALPPDFTTISLAALKDRMPLNLGMILYAEASRLRANETSRPACAAMFMLASAAADVLHGALARLSLNDGLAEELSWRGIAEAAIEAARIGDPAALSRFALLHDSNSTSTDRASLVWRGLIELINADAIPLARQLMAQEHLTMPPETLSPATKRDSLIVLAQLALEPDGNPLDAMAIAETLGSDDPASASLLREGFIRLANQSRYTEALDWVAPVSATLSTNSAASDASRSDTNNALAIVIEHAADPASIATLLRPLMLDATRRDGILLDAFCRLIDAGRYTEAISMADSENIVSRAVARDDAAGRNARLALALLDLATGDPMDVPARLAGLAIDAQRRRDMLISAFSRLVNAARYQDAQNFAAAHHIEAFAASADQHDHTPSSIDAVIGLAILDLVLGDPAHAPARIENVPIDAERRRQITLGAFVTLVNRARYDEATNLRAASPIETWSSISTDDDGTDAAIALIALTLASGDPGEVVRLLEILPALSQSARADARAQAALRLIHLGRFDEARPLIASIDYRILDPASRRDLLATEAHFALESHDITRLAALLDALATDNDDPARITLFARQGFVTAVNRSDFAGAAQLRHRIEPDFTNNARATTDTLRSAGYALGVLNLQHPTHPHRAEAAFAAVRRGFAAVLHEGDDAPELFWEALRGEIIALHATDRAAEATALGRAMITRYGSPPADLADQLTGKTP